MNKTELHLRNAQSELAMAHLAALKDDDRETAQEIGVLESATTNLLELLKRKRLPRNHPG